MNRADLNQLIETTFKNILDLSNTKGREYSGTDDALSNFKRNAERIGLDPLQIWHVYAAKHYDSICTFIKDTKSPTPRILSEPIEGRVDDMITYLILFKGLLADHRKPINPPVNIQE